MNVPVSTGFFDRGACCMAKAVTVQVAFFYSPRYRTLANAHRRLTTPETCSTRARIRDLLRFLARHFGAVGQTLAVHVDVSRHAQVPLLAFACLMYVPANRRPAWTSSTLL